LCARRLRTSRKDFHGVERFGSSSANPTRCKDRRPLAREFRSSAQYPIFAEVSMFQTARSINSDTATAVTRFMTRAALGRCRTLQSCRLWQYSAGKLYCRRQSRSRVAAILTRLQVKTKATCSWRTQGVQRCFRPPIRCRRIRTGSNADLWRDSQPIIRTQPTGGHDSIFEARG